MGQIVDEIDTSCSISTLPSTNDAHAVDMAAWLARAEVAELLAKMLVKSSFVPDSFRPRHNPNNADEAAKSLQIAVANTTAAILAGQSIGLDPLTSLQNIFIVNGKPSMYAKMQVAVLRSVGHEIWVAEYGPDAVTVLGRARGSSREIRVRLTIEDAKRAGWTKNDTYTKTPADMLYARCAARVCAQLDPGALMGIPCADAPDDTPATWIEVAAATPAVATLPSIPQLGLPAPEQVRITRAEKSPLPAAKSTLAEIGRRLGAMSIPDVDRPRIVAALVGRPVDSLSQLTAAEADILRGSLLAETSYDTVAAILGWDTGTGEITSSGAE